MSIGKTEFLSRPYTKEFNEGWDRIWGKKINPPVLERELEAGDWIGTTPYKPKEAAE